MNKSGPLSRQDKQFIINNVDSMSVESIAEHLERNPKSIQKHIERSKLGKKFEVDPSVSDKSQNEILADLQTRPFFKNLGLQFTEDETQYFCDYWVLTVQDFGGNILSYEELELKEWLTFEILKTRALKQNRVNVHRKESYQDELKEEFNYAREERDKDRIKFLQGEITGISEDIKKYSREFADLADKADKIKKGLVKNREQRTKDLDMANLDFSSYLKILMTDVDAKRRVGHEMEVMRMGQEEKRGELYQFHTFADNKVDIPILNSKSVDKLIESEKEDDG